MLLLKLLFHPRPARSCPRGAFGRAVRGIGGGPDSRGAHSVPPDLPAGRSHALSPHTGRTLTFAHRAETQAPVSLLWVHILTHQLCGLRWSQVYLPEP